MVSSPAVMGATDEGSEDEDDVKADYACVEVHVSMIPVSVGFVKAFWFLVPRPVFCHPNSKGDCEGCSPGQHFRLGFVCRVQRKFRPK